MPSRILITGASGFIGSYLAERALAEGYETWVAVRPTSSRRYLTDPRLRFIEADLSSDRSLRRTLERHLAAHGAFDHVIHAAGATKCRHASDFFAVNAEGTLRLARALHETGALRPEGRFVFISSLSVMGPACEDEDREILPTDQPVPDTAYGCSKLAAEGGLREIDGLNYIVLRPTGVYGPRERDYFLMVRSIRRHLDFAVGFRRQYLTFIYVADLVEAAFAALTRGVSGRAYFLTDGETYSSRAFSDYIQAALGVRGVLHVTAPLWLLRLVCGLGGLRGRCAGRATTLNPDKYRIMRQRNWRCDISKACAELGYRPAWPLKRGVNAMIDYYRERGEL